ncbi:hydrogenase maturation nickel metallochaperone HypA [Brooklawnia cerclae]|uniref:Hydrogenase maturation factor HypA n=1 Tax=Brooklawnia cerclae TaxID=349934 RepID=A0ABX0SB73_9ACTN|nr:hydrogenase maturation nickel metallochaperone HypA [Brooklawnia cerclae]NIH55647.1 hydrogenase nickel incorporation protein HypA/HybF [Brooklawnia cerclae]
MHELGVTRAVLKVVLAEANERGLTSVVGITLTVGEMHGFEQEWIQRYFSAAARGTAAEGARITMVPVPPRFRCRLCEADFAIDVRRDRVPRCPRCHARDYELLAGKELMVTGMQAF